MKRFYFLFLLAGIMIGANNNQAMAQVFCQAGFTFSITGSNPNGTQVQFYDSSFVASGNITGYSWYFSNGMTSTQQNPVMTFAPGVYSICLTITTGPGASCTSQYCDTIAFGGVLPCNSNFQAFVQSGSASFYPAVTSGATYLWNFGDGSTSTQMQPNHAYANPGVYNVCLSIAYGGATCTSCQTITIAGGSSCSASFQAFPDSTGAVYFQNTSTGSGLSYAWTFSNGASSTLQNPYINFGAPGWYYACLNIYNNAQSCSDTYCDSIYVSGGSGLPCDANFSYQSSPAGGYLFTPTGTGNVSWSWNFGDGTTSSLANPNHVYAQGGTYQVILTVVNSAGLSCTSLQTIIVGNTLSCSANFAIYPDSTQLHTYIGVNLAYGNGPLTYNWTWGDGTSSTGAYPSHTYAGPGTYTICLYIADANGCSDSTCYSFALLRMQSGVPITVNVVQGNTGVQENGSANQVSLFPVPARDQVQVRVNMTNAETVQLRMLDLSGREVLSPSSNVLQAGENNVTVGLTNLPAGAYIIEVSGSTFKTYERLIVE
ncbi:MAG: PKD domain-containing protein [Arcticibacter sp.]